ncbi:MAG TPA: hypothetical protein VKB51_08945 [bacterium]|nr:hypothetical protein [bacterium]
MIALALQIRIVFLLLLVGLTLWLLVRLWRAATCDPRLRRGLPLLLAGLLRRGALPLLVVLLRILRVLR